MKSNIHLLSLPSIQISPVEDKLIRMQELHQKIKELEAEYDMLKEEVIISHFIHCAEYKTAKGLLLATRHAYTEKRFNSGNFQKDFPDIYDNYKEEKTIFKFLLK